ncbi:hypothetical protein [Dyadobacter psychrotolerans]|uniref:Uncharacterized protein n=1 Tax=Dyadobacter psychrotolerans TaxID=2541721 RepID=A0A4R5DKM9_9BACT|nr:hypothetical protein [Dyadobacter psychrotolerans]TDE14736.1 hypothetical protein E0F88_16245 [Dyadobacter psychrotolerans]
MDEKNNFIFSFPRVCLNQKTTLFSPKKKQEKKKAHGKRPASKPKGSGISTFGVDGVQPASIMAVIMPNAFGLLIKS